MEFINVKLSDIGEIVGGSTPSTKNLANYDGNIAWITPKDLAGYSKVYISRGERNISENGFKSCSTKMLPKNSVLFSSRAPIGYVAISENDLCTNQGFKSIIPNSKVDYKFLYYLLKHKKDYIASKGSGSTFKEVSGSVMKGIELSIPKDINIQKKVSKVLFDIDQKIELNNKINNNLFELLKQNFKEKFYNTKVKDSYMIDYISKTIGGDWGKENSEGNNNTKVNCVRGADIPSMEYGNKGNAPVRYILEKNYKSKKLVPNNIIIEVSGGSPTQSTGRTAYITKNILDMYDSPLLCTNFCRVIEAKKNILAPFVYMNLKLMYEDNIFFNWENGTTGIKNLALNDMLSNLEVKSPNENDLNSYYVLFNNIMNKIANNSNENFKLGQLRDTLLPKLMNGEIDLENIEI